MCGLGRPVARWALPVSLQVLLGVGALLASPAQQLPTFSSDVSLVRVDVSVLGRDRQPVKGLTAADFSVSEDGKAQPIAAFSEVVLPEPTKTTPLWGRNVPSDVERNDTASDRRLVVLVLDDAMAPSEAMVTNSTRDIAKKVIAQLGPGDLAAVTFTADGRRSQPFTQDRAKLLAAVDTFSPGLHQLSNLFSPSIAVVNMEKARALSVTATLRMLVEALGSIPDRRKSVIFISVGAAVDVDSVVQTAPSDPTPQAYAAMKDIVRLAQRASVNIYTVDPGGLDGMRILLQQQVPFTRFEVEQKEYLERVEVLSRSFRDFNRVFADNTGGKAFFNTNEFDTGVAQILRETGSFYLLGYRSSNQKADGRFRRIQVRVKKPGLTVNARRGYYGPEPPRAGGVTPPAPMIDAIAVLLPRTDLPLQATAASVMSPGEREATVLVTAALRTAVGAPKGGTNHVKMTVNAFTLEGQARGSSQVEADVSLGALESRGDESYDVTARLKLAPGRYQLRLFVESGLDSKSGSVYCDLEVPDSRTGAVGLSGLFFSAGAGAPAASANGPAALPPTPTARRTFTAADNASAFVRIYQGGQDPLRSASVRTWILSGDGSVVFDTARAVDASEFGPGREVNHAAALPLSRLTPGPHLLRVQVTVGNASALREVPFLVR
jgi:VWFA-related protein